MKQFETRLDESYENVIRKVERGLETLAGDDLIRMKTIQTKKKKKNDDDPATIEREYTFHLDDVPSMLRNALGAETMRVRESCWMEERRRVSRFENQSMRSMFRVVVIETYEPDPKDPQNKTRFRVDSSMDIMLPWPVKTIANRFAMTNYEPKLLKKVQTIRSLVETPNNEGKTSIDSNSPGM